MGNNSVPKFIFRLSRFPVYGGSVLGRFYCITYLSGKAITITYLSGKAITITYLSVKAITITYLSGKAITITYLSGKTITITNLSGKAKTITYRNVFCSVSYPSCNANTPYYTAVCGLSVQPYFSTLSQKGHDFQKNIIEHKMLVLIFCTNLFKTFVL